jgi:iron complex outermembrane receptor protein
LATFAFFNFNIIKMQKKSTESVQLTHFRRWSRKRYGIFSSLHRVVKICQLSVGLGMIALPISVNAQVSDSTDSELYAELDELIVTSERTPVTAAQSTKFVTVISKREIEAAPAGTIDDLLEYALNVDVRQRGNYGIQSDVSIKGGNYEQTLILLNGVNISDPQTGHYSLNLPLDLESIERVEILHGTAARVFGPNAFSGVINLITSANSNNRQSWSVMAGEHGLNKLSANLNLNQFGVKQYFAVSRSSSDGYIKNTDFKNTNLFYQGTLPTSKGDFAFQTGYNAKAYGANAFYSGKYPNQYEITSTNITSLSFTSKTRLQFSPVIYWRRNNDEFQLFRSNAPAWYKGHNYHQNNVYGANLNLSLATLLGKSSLGFQFRREEILSNNIGTPLVRPIEIDGADTSYTLGYQRNNLAIFAEHSFTWNKIIVSGGCLANYNSDFSGLKFSPGIDIAYQMLSFTKLYISANKAMRMPTFTDLFYKSSTNVGNPDLKPEEAESLEVGVNYSQPVFSVHAAGFVRNSKNLIDWIKKPNDVKWYTVNYGEIQFVGFEASAQLKPQNLQSISLPINYLTVSYSYLQSNKQSGDFESKYVLDHLKHKLNLSACVPVWKSVALSWQSSYQERKGGFSPWNSSTSSFDAEVAYKPVWLSDARIFWKTDNWRIFVEASNIFDVQVYDQAEVLQPGRWFKLGVTYGVDF